MLSREGAAKPVRVLEPQLADKEVSCLPGRGLPEYPSQTPSAVRSSPWKHGLDAKVAMDFNVQQLGPLVSDRGMFSWPPQKERERCPWAEAKV